MWNSKSFFESVERSQVPRGSPNPLSVLWVRLRDRNGGSTTITNQCCLTRMSMEESRADVIAPPQHSTQFVDSSSHDLLLDEGDRDPDTTTEVNDPVLQT